MILKRISFLIVIFILADLIEGAATGIYQEPSFYLVVVFLLSLLSTWAFLEMKTKYFPAIGFGFIFVWAHTLWKHQLLGDPVALVGLGLMCGVFNLCLWHLKRSYVSPTKDLK